MAKHRTHSIEFKRQVVHEFLGGESPHALAKRHGVSRNLIKIWVAKYEAGGLDSDAAAADVLADYEARIAALERLVGKLDRFRSPVAGPQQPRPGFVAYYVRVWGVLGGAAMKKLLLASVAVAIQIVSPALAADWPTPPPAYAEPPPPAIYSWWTGCYLGGNLGGAWSRASYTHDNAIVVEDFTFTPVAVIGGGQLGCQYQWSSLVFGVEGTWSWSNLRQSQPSTLLPNRERSFGVEQIGTATVRVGYAWDRTMLYAKAGWAAAKIDTGAKNIPTGISADFIDWSNGWTVGVGLEHVPWQSIVLGVEANFYDISSFDHTGQDTAGGFSRNFNTSAPIWAITVRASYLFGPPIVTRYVN